MQSVWWFEVWEMFGVVSYLDIAGLLHQALSVLCRPVAFWELDPEKFQRTLKVSLKQVVLGGLHADRKTELV